MPGLIESPFNISDETVSDLVKEATVNLLQLNPVEVSTQLMVEDFTIFRQIEATEYVDDLFDIKSRFVLAQRFVLVPD